MRQTWLTFAALAVLSCSQGQTLRGPAQGHAHAMDAGDASGTEPGKTGVNGEEEAPVDAKTSAAWRTAAWIAEPGHVHPVGGHPAGSHQTIRTSYLTGNPTAEDIANAPVSVLVDKTENHLSPEEVAKRVSTDLKSLGSMSLGRPNAGALVNGVQMPEGERWDLVIPFRAYATQETIDYLVTAIDAVHTAFPGAHKLSVGHLSKETGGRLYPHRSHQSGRDIDIGYYYVPEKAEWYRPATKQTLDLDRTWAFVKSFVVDTDVEMIFMDRRVQKLVKAHALSIGEDPAWLNSLFQYKSRHPEPLIRHAPGHRTHLHVRFYNPKAQLLGVQAYDALVKTKVIKPRHSLVPYQTRANDTLAALAQKAGTSAATIKKVNGIGGLRPGQLLYVPMRGHVSHVKQVIIPARRLPPIESGSGAHVASPAR